MIFTPGFVIGVLVLTSVIWMGWIPTKSNKKKREVKKNNSAQKEKSMETKKPKEEPSAPKEENSDNSPSQD